MNEKTLVWLVPLILLAWLLFPFQGYGADLTEATCESDRVLFLQDPPLTGDDVMELQQGLKFYGFYDGPENGIFDRTTEHAVRNFQQKAQLTVDGKVGTETWKALAATFLYPAVAKSKDPEGELSIVIDLNKRQLFLYSGGNLHKAYPVAIGKSKTPSPIGEWKIVNKSRNWGGGFGTRWLGLNVPWGIYGIHGTNKPWSIGNSASAGCFRMFNHQVEELYRWVKIGTPVKVVGNTDPSFPQRTLEKGMTGQDVVYLQLALREMGFDPGTADARFGSSTEDAVKALQSLYGIPADGVAGPDVYYLLGVK